MAESTRSLDQIKTYLEGQPALTAGEPYRLFKEIVEHMVRQQKEIDDLKRSESGGRPGTPIVRGPDGNVHL